MRKEDKQQMSPLLEKPDYLDRLPIAEVMRQRREFHKRWQQHPHEVHAIMRKPDNASLIME